MAWIEVQSTGSGNMARGMRQVAGFRVRSGCVIGTCKSGFGEEDLCWDKPLDEVHGPLAARTWPGSRLTGQRRICCRRRLMEQAAAEWEHLSACAVVYAKSVRNVVSHDFEAAFPLGFPECQPELVEMSFRKLKLLEETSPYPATAIVRSKFKIPDHQHASFRFLAYDFAVGHQDPEVRDCGLLLST